MKQYNHINPLTGEQGAYWEPSIFASAGEEAALRQYWKSKPLNKKFWTACKFGPFPDKQKINIGWA